LSDPPGILAGMTDSTLQSLSSDDLLAATRDLVRKSCRVEADLLLHLAEIDERKLYLQRAFPSMFAFCMEELGFSVDATYYRLTVARAGRQFPAILDALRAGKIHLAGLRLLVPHLTEENHREVLAQAANRSKRQIEEIVARLAPLPPVPDSIRRIPPASRAREPVPLLARSPIAARPPAPPAGGPAAASAVQQQREQRGVMSALAPEMFKVEFTASVAFRDKLEHARDLLRHRIPNGSMAQVLEKALEVLIEQVSKERFATGRKPRPSVARAEKEGTSRHIPDAVKRAVYERDGGRCTFTDERGNRCPETGMLEFEHEDGFARTQEHDPKRIRLLCRAHNQYAAEQMYGRAFMEAARARGKPTRPGASSREAARRAEAAESSSGGSGEEETGAAGGQNGGKDQESEKEGEQHRSDCGGEQGGQDDRGGASVGSGSEQEGQKSGGDREGQVESKTRSRRHASG
jgi:hypothetical protein